MSDGVNKRRSIQDIVPPARSKPIRLKKETQAPAPQEPSSELPPPPPGRGPGAHIPKDPDLPKRRTGGVGLMSVIFILVVGLIGGTFVIVSTVFYRATVVVEKQLFSAPVAATFDTSENDPLLPLTTHSFDKTLEKSVSKSGSEYVEARASGQITVFNEFSSQSQRLITNTRFEAPDGRIYRIENPIVVPGLTNDDGVITPGELTVTVYADEPGESFNLTEIVEFTIPGLRGSQQFNDMYARSAGSITGGFVGDRAVVDEDIREVAVSELRAQLQSELRDGFMATLPEGDIFFEDTLDITFDEHPDVATADGAVVSVTGRLTGVTFKNNDIARSIAASVGIVYEQPLTITNIDTLAFSYTDEEDEENTAQKLTISGEAQLEGVYDENQLIQDLAGKSRGNVGSVLAGYPAIQDMRISIYPFWRSNIPENIEKIIIHNETPR